MRYVAKLILKLIQQKVSLYTILNSNYSGYCTFLVHLEISRMGKAVPRYY